MHEGLVLEVESVADFLDMKLAASLQWINSFREQKRAALKTEMKQLVDENVVELDENLRKHWPRKGKLEVEFYQTRKAQITAHNKKYERHVRNTLERNASHAESFGISADRFRARLEDFTAAHQAL